MEQTHNTGLAFPNLYKQQYANLTTYKKSGEAVATPVWFAERSGVVYVMTVADAGKVKRIRNNRQVELAPCTQSGKPLGPELAGHARVLAAGEEALAKEALDEKYGLFKAVFDFFMNVRGTQRAYLAIEATR
jgi:hypothetical protein